ncbi:nitrilase-related carbon-nitrogen hydrolase [Kibdelosporangium phytohabitans]|uniref:CN hydrolase domain-containing protein n=1 Tax=Kibdelosporangium phytohabitans TaxID=860235 RepID=A0A0N9HSQ3_9PSEU|nr:nitrilase-related carbon-nitrogen hydrolase [Kibdelosporangium phytohabitans]ALG05862.1 hypothetical protein AOZ06_02045 [Kibdelosporangium phytohabitans]MBE1466104.1 apolipoprotein N-acyltransferase [Kibdelosporangium phytohabitans]
MGSAKWLPAAATVASAALLYFGTGLSPIPLLAWLFPLPLLLVAKKVSGWAAAGAGFAAGFAGSTNFWYWSAQSHDLPLWPWGVVIATAFGVTFALAVTVFRLLPPAFGVLAAPAAWVTPLYLAAALNPMGIEGTLVTSEVEVPVVMQATSALGPWGVEFLIFFIPTAVATWRPRIALVAAAVAALVVGGGVLRLTADPGPSQRVALLASNQKGWATDLDTAAGRTLLADYVQQLYALPEGVDMVVLPEAAFASAREWPSELTELMRRIATGRALTIVVGFQHVSPTAKYNYALSFPNGARYLKHHDAVSPLGTELVFAEPGRVGMTICFDVNFRSPSADYAVAGARMLAFPASDEDHNGWRHSRTALLRGVENGMAIAWSGRKTTLMLSDGYGRVIASKPTGPGTDGFTTVIGDVPLGPGATLYSRFGDWFAWLCLAVTALALVKAFARKKDRPAADHG